MPILTKAQLQEAIEKNDGNIEGEIILDLDTLISNDIEGVNDIASERLIGSQALQGIGYEAVGVTDDGQIRVNVAGFVDEEALDLYPGNA